MSAADVETQSQQETSNGTSKFDVPEIELIIKVGYTLHYTTLHQMQIYRHYTCTHMCINLWCACVCVCIWFLYAGFANFLCCTIKWKRCCTYYVQQQKEQQQHQRQRATLSSSFLTFCLPLLLLCHMKSKTYSHYVHFLFFVVFFFVHIIFISIYSSSSLYAGRPLLYWGSLLSRFVCLFFSLLRLPMLLLSFFF